MSFKKADLESYSRSLSIFTFTLSLTQTAFCTQSSCVPAVNAAATGWAGLYMGGAMLSWCANPFLYIAWIAYRKSSYASLICSAIASVLMLSFLFFKEIYNHQEEWASDIINYGLGYYLWILSGILIVFGNIYALRQKFLPKNLKIRTFAAS